VSSTTERNDFPIVDLQEVASQYDDATSAIRNSSLVRRWTTTSAGRKLAQALYTIPLLCAEVTRLRSRLARTVIDLQNLVAAARATLSAHREGESDPLYYLRDELEAQGQLPPDDRKRP
jgi:hypothetical protein